MDVMSAANLSMVMSQAKVMNELSTGVLSMALDSAESAGGEMVKSLESLVSPSTMGTVVDTLV